MKHLISVGHYTFPVHAIRMVSIAYGRISSASRGSGFFDIDLAGTEANSYTVECKDIETAESVRKDFLERLEKAFTRLSGEVTVGDVTVAGDFFIKPGGRVNIEPAGDIHVSQSKEPSDDPTN